ncbi:MAG: cobalamin biosynthesis protein CobD/CbiB [Ferrimicrobium sp.]
MARSRYRRPSALVVLGAMVLDELLGDPANRWHPVRWFGIGVDRLEGHVYADSRASGVALWSLALVPSLVLPPLLWPGGRIVEALGLWLTLGGRSLVREAEALAALLEAGDLSGARLRLGNLVGRDTAGLGVEEIARAAIESLAENTTDAVLGPLWWYAVGGLSGALAFRSSNTLDAMVGHQNRRYQNFGYFSAKVDDLAVTPAAILGVIVSWLGAHGEQRRRISRLITLAPQHPSLNAGLIEAAFAGTLGVDLGGVNHYRGRAVSTPRFLGGSPPDVRALRGASRLSRQVAWMSALVAILAIIAGS